MSKLYFYMFIFLHLLYILPNTGLNQQLCKKDWRQGRTVGQKCKVDIVWPTSGINLYKYRTPPSFVFQQGCQKRKVFKKNIFILYSYQHPTSSFNGESGYVNNEKLSCLINYFRRVTQEESPKGVVTFTRRSLSESQLPNWKLSTKCLPKLRITSDGTIN